jgi:uncharacterized membrane protein (DUF485 family)
MIQRKQTLFLLQVAFLALCFLFVPIQFVNQPNPAQATLLPSGNSTPGHLAAVGLNAMGLMLAIVTIFLFKRRELQIKLCYVLMAIYIILPFMMAFCPFIAINAEPRSFETNMFGYIISAVNVLAAYLAARFVKRDIDLIKSADRIR